MTKTVEVIVSNRIVSKAAIVPYSHERGLQYYVGATGFVSDTPVLYEVPAYALRIEGGRVSYRAIRFGLRNLDNSTPDLRHCDVGLSHHRVCTPGWIPGYSPHSFAGHRPGAWRLLPGKGFLIHEGADSRAATFGGTLGCIEVLDGGWSPFLEEIERIGGNDCLHIGAARRLNVSIEYATYPDAKKVS